MRPAVRLFGVALAGLALALACGARTGLDVVANCEEPARCLPGLPGNVYQCGVPIRQCGVLEQCVEPCGKGGTGEACAAMCENPCLNTLGQNTSNGCEFYAVEMDTTPSALGTCYAVFVVNQWQTGQPAKLEVDLGGVPYTPDQLMGFARIPSGAGTGISYAPFTGELPQNEIAILFLSRDPQAAASDPVANDSTVLANCPPGVTPAVVGDAALHGTGIGTAFHIRTNVPVVAYQMLPYGGGHARVTGATLLLPTNVWGTNYMAANAYSVPQATGLPEDQARAGPTMAIIAQEDDTRVTINSPTWPIVAGGTLTGTPAGVPITYMINQGQYLQFTQPNELTGSPIQSDKPVAVIGGSTLIDLPSTTSRADSAEQMLPPISALSSEYVAVRYRSRDPNSEESTLWRLVGIVDGTVLTFDPPLPDVPNTLGQGQILPILDPGPWVVSSQDADHPFYFAQYMTGGGYLDETKTSAIYGAGDPEFVNVIPPAQYLPGYTFFTDPTYPETNLVIVAALDAATNQFPTVNLDCAGTLTGWQPVGTKGKYQFTRLDLSTGNFQGQNGCNNGVHGIKASLEGAPPGDAAAFGVTVWGWGSGATLPCTTEAEGTNANEVAEYEANPNYTCWVSYAYPAGVNLAKLNDVFVPAN
jgi:hypothetical protein